MKNQPQETKGINEFHLPEEYKHMHGRYTPPDRTEIKGIDTFIVDPHNEALPFWYFGPGSYPSLLIHVDKHPDTCDGVKTLRIPKDKSKTYADFARYAKGLNPGTLILPAIHENLVGIAYFIDPRENQIGRLCFTDIGGERITREDEEGKLRVRSSSGLPTIYMLDSRKAIRDINKGSQILPGNLILDIDLDAFGCTEDQEYNRLGAPFREKRFQKTFDLLKQLPKPDRITIARSQTPFAFVPPEIVSELELRVYDELEKIY